MIKVKEACMCMRCRRSGSWKIDIKKKTLNDKKFKMKSLQIDVAKKLVPKTSMANKSPLRFVRNFRTKILKYLEKLKTGQ